MANQSIIAIPSDLTSEVSLKRTLQIIAQEVDKLKGTRGSTDTSVSGLNKKVNFAEGKATEAIDSVESARRAIEELRVEMRITGKLSKRLDELEFSINSLASQIIPDAPSDGNIYARRNGQWIVITP